MTPYQVSSEIYGRVLLLGNYLNVTHNRKDTVYVGEMRGDNLSRAPELSATCEATVLRARVSKWHIRS